VLNPPTAVGTGFTKLFPFFSARFNNSIALLDAARNPSATK